MADNGGGSSSDAMVKIKPQNEDLAFNGSNVKRFLSEYQLAARLDGASEKDMAQQLGFFIAKDKLLDVVETLEGYEPPDWPKLKASMIAYWGNVDTTKFSLPDPVPSDQSLEEENPQNLERGLPLGSHNDLLVEEALESDSNFVDLDVGPELFDKSSKQDRNESIKTREPAWHPTNTSLYFTAASAIEYPLASRINKSNPSRRQHENLKSSTVLSVSLPPVKDSTLPVPDSDQEDMDDNPELFEQSTEDPSPAEVTAARLILALNPVASPINNHLSTEISENLSSASASAATKDKEKFLVDQKGHNYFLPSGAWIPFDPVRPIRSVVTAFQASSRSAPPFPAPYRISCGALQPWYPTTKPIPCADPPVSESYHCHLIRKSPNIKSSQPKVLSSDPPSPKCLAKFVKEANSVLKKIINLMVPGFSASSLDNVHLPKSQIPRRTKARKVIPRRHNGVKVSSLQYAPPGLDATKIVKTLSRATLVSNGQPSALDSPGVPDPTSSETLRDEVKLSSDPPLCSVPDLDPIGQLRPTSERMVSFPIALRDEVKLSSDHSLHSVPNLDPIGQLRPTSERLVPSSIALQNEVKLSSDPSLCSVPDLDPIGQLRPTAESLVSSSIRLHKEATLNSQVQESVFSSQASSDPNNHMSSLSHNYQSHPSGVPKSSITPEVHQSQSSQPLSNSVDPLSSSSPIRLRNEDKPASVPIPNPLRNETKQTSESSNVEYPDPVSSDGVQASGQVENDLCNEGELGLLHFDEEEGWMIEVFPRGGKVDQNPPSRPQGLLEEFIEVLSDNLIYKLQNTYNIRNPSLEQRTSLCYYLIKQILAENGKSLADVGLRPIAADDRLWWYFDTVSAREETMRITDHTNRFLEMSARLNQKQSAIADAVIGLTSAGEAGLIYVDGPGGCGKTFLLNTLIHYFNASEIPVITVASSGVASLMLINGMTAHSRFKIPLNVKYAVEAVDQAFRSLMDNEQPFGGKIVIFGGDFRQTLPVVPGGSVLDQGRCCMISSAIWNDVFYFQLTQNLRLRASGDDQSARSNLLRPTGFAEWLLSVGNGSGQTDFTADIDIAFGWVYRHSDARVVAERAIVKTYGDMAVALNDPEAGRLNAYFGNRLILAPLNSDVNRINAICSSRLPGEVFVSHSINQMRNEEDGEDSDEAIPEEVLRTFSIPGFPEADIELKVGMPVILLRNLDLKRGLSNGTRLLVLAIRPDALRCRILTGSCTGAEIAIPRIRHGPKYSFASTRYLFSSTCWECTSTRPRVAGAKVQVTGLTTNPRSHWSHAHRQTHPSNREVLFIAPSNPDQPHPPR
ncbi:uncharacterized protein PGTG_12981 [Puccinia graminis f. sp. tritici CRL 75-36-700-3]|uniref:ATP-dependent DNA helicase n=1 Tax=Puccinia graminis f. sp. tritici (strain CRL 75-36-700-3 / race SCCL) TaxID=418459 RepID=E3KQM4_PUCGT|nr:uncharacterized protein PGTG_12981 [Puccinia graminis f. sp. tritici CRL 75-36-700-3]EFP86599.2 hypothetical protein PGTG_12981 [Puccinia graminis f. sp. tritici CRL 75-36-700-3]